MRKQPSSLSLSFSFSRPTQNSWQKRKKSMHTAILKSNHNWANEHTLYKCQTSIYTFLFWLMFSSIPSRSFNQCHFFRIYLSLNIWERPRCVGDHSIQQICNFRFFINILSCDFLLILFFVSCFCLFCRLFFLSQKCFFSLIRFTYPLNQIKEEKKVQRRLCAFHGFLNLWSQ